MKLPLPIGVSDYCKASSEYYYVDKTMLIKEFLDQKPMVSLFTRPRRFGKTLTMDMLRVFFEKTEEDTSVFFRNRAVWKCGEQYRRYQGQYPIIFLTFKDVIFDSWAGTMEKIKELLQTEFGRHRELADSERCEAYERAYFTKVLNGSAGEVELTSALANLSRMLDKHHGIAPIIMIDEYDTPIQQGYRKGYYENVILFMRNLFSGAFKDNRHLSYGFLTGILRVAQESIFSGLNNLKINSVPDDQYSEHFGFTHEEVKEMADYYEVPEKYDELCDWYDGYWFGNDEMFNPWSVIGYFGSGCKPQPFWVSTSGNEVIGELLENATPDTMERLNKLIQGQTVLTRIDTNVVYPQLSDNPSAVYSLLLVSGYLKVISRDILPSGDYMCEVAIPNREITAVYKKEILSHLGKSSTVPDSSALAIQEALYTQDGTALQKALQRFLYQTISCHDAASENYYQGLLTGLLAMMDDRYTVRSNRESGNGRYDFQLYPRTKELPGILIEVKAGKGLSGEALTALAKTALQQINDRAYDTEMKLSGVEKVLKFGIAFCGKDVQIISE